ncbi:glycosyltransferase family 2 protein [Fontivita pretiosa]|uniref:glycosyltransferase family 2 protein n=1 Tax=Fontivita pretiosa TaxID=2989684 RepID=UPI003D178C5E
MSNNPLTSVIIVACHGQKWIGPCVRSLCQSTRNLPVQVILVDNGGTTPGLVELSELFRPMCVVRTAQVLGFADANNFALRHVDPATDAVCFLNQDTLSGEDWLSQCVTELRADDMLGAVVPMIRTYDWAGWDPEFLSCMRQAEGSARWIESGAELRSVYYVPYAPAAAMVVKASVLRQVGPFDPVFGSYYEDYDLCRRIRGAGYRIGIITGARVAHYSGSATRTASERRCRGRRIVRNRVLYEIRLAGRRRTMALLRYFALSFPRNLARSLMGRSAHPPLEFLRGHLDLLPLTRRMLSEAHDRCAWRADLARSGFAFAAGASEIDRRPTRSSTAVT